MTISVVSNLWAGRPKNRSFSRGGQRYFSYRRVQTNSETHRDARSVGVKPTAHLHLVSSKGMRGTIRPFCHTSSWHGAYLSSGIILHFYFILYYNFYFFTAVKLHAFILYRPINSCLFLLNSLFHSFI